MKERSMDQQIYLNQQCSIGETYATVKSPNAYNVIYYHIIVHIIKLKRYEVYFNVHRFRQLKDLKLKLQIA